MADKYIEEWLPVPDYEGFYEVSSLGRIRSVDRVVGAKAGSTRHLRGKIREQVVDEKGYMRIVLHKEGKKTKFRVHRLVARAFLSDTYRPRKEVNHKDMDKTNNKLENLEWVTGEENLAHAEANWMPQLEFDF